MCALKCLRAHIKERERNCFAGHLLFHFQMKNEKEKQSCWHYSASAHARLLSFSFSLIENEIERDLMTDGYDRPEGHKIASVGLFLSFSI